MIKAFHELGLDYSAMFCTSAGSLNGCIFHTGDVDKLEHLWLNLSSSKVYKWRFDLLSSRPSVYDSSPMLVTIKKNINYSLIKNNSKNFYISVTDYFEQENFFIESKTIDEETLCKFIQASASPPILFQPIDIAGKTYIDGGLTSNFNIKDAIVKEDVETVILFSPTSKGRRKEIKNILDIATDTISIPMYTQLKEEEGCVGKINDIIDDVNISLQSKYKKINLVPIVADREFDFGFLDFDYKGFDRKELIKWGYDFAKEKLIQALS